jgi:hypothetical protein
VIKMSLVCAHCGNTIVLSDNPDHYGICSECPINEVTPEEKAMIARSSADIVWKRQLRK